MTISVNWSTKVITIPKADTTLESIGPPEVRSYDVYNLFWKQAIAAVASEEGAPFDDITEHNTTVDIGGVTLGHVVRVINGYTVTFEDGSYQVNCVGANHNLLDVANMNLVALRSANSAGLVEVVGTAGDWTDTEKEQFRDRVGIDGASSSPVATPSLAGEVTADLLAASIDGKSFQNIMADLLAMANGKIVESPSGTFIFYEQDNATVRYTLAIAGGSRVRA